MEGERKKRQVKPNVTKAPPSAQEVRKARATVQQTTWSAANVVYVTTRQWQKYESGAAEMSAASFELYQIKTGQF